MHAATLVQVTPGLAGTNKLHVHMQVRDVQARKQQAKQVQLQEDLEQAAAARKQDEAKEVIKPRPAD